MERYNHSVKTFTERELKFVRKLRDADIDTTLELHESCPNHSVCTPLPVFRVHRESDDVFNAQWNTHHSRGPQQSFRFDGVSVD